MTIHAQAKWQFAQTPAEPNALVLRGTGDYRLDGVPLALGGDPPGTARASLDGINARRRSLGLPEIVVTNTRLSTAAD